MDEQQRLTRVEQQRRTRAALVASAARSFARDGYHGASLEEIAAAAGYSKGAVYSNFEGKAELFLAVLDLSIAALEQHSRGMAELWADDAVGRDAAESADGHPPAHPLEDWDSVGISLATLEFLAAASRDPELAPALQARTERIVAHFTGIARRARSDADGLPPEQLGILLTALDQGLGLLTLMELVDGSPGELIEPRVWIAGLRRLADPVRAGYDLPDDSGGGETGRSRDDG